MHCFDTIILADYIGGNVAQVFNQGDKVVVSHEVEREGKVVFGPGDQIIVESVQIDPQSFMRTYTAYSQRLGNRVDLSGSDLSPVPRDNRENPDVRLRPFCIRCGQPTRRRESRCRNCSELTVEEVRCSSCGLWQTPCQACGLCGGPIVFEVTCSCCGMIQVPKTYGHCVNCRRSLKLTNTAFTTYPTSSARDDEAEEFCRLVFTPRPLAICAGVLAILSAFAPWYMNWGDSEWSHFSQFVTLHPLTFSGLWAILIGILACATTHKVFSDKGIAKICILTGLAVIGLVVAFFDEVAVVSSGDRYGLWMLMVASALMIYTAFLVSQRRKKFGKPNPGTSDLSQMDS